MPGQLEQDRHGLGLDAQRAARPANAAFEREHITPCDSEACFERHLNSVWQLRKLAPRRDAVGVMNAARHGRAHFDDALAPTGAN